MKKYKKPTIKEKVLKINFFTSARLFNNHSLGTELLASAIYTPGPCVGNCSDCPCITNCDCACQTLTEQCDCVCDCNCDCDCGS